MNPTLNPTHRSFFRLLGFRPTILIAAIALLAAVPASALETAYRYYQFKTTKLVGGGSNLMFSEFDFYLGGEKLNIRNKTGVGTSIPCNATAGTLDPDSETGSNKILDGLTSTKMIRTGGLLAGNEVVFDFGATLPHPVVDSYSFTSAEDSANFIRTPQSWHFSGSDDGVNWTVIDAKIDAITTLANVTLYGPYSIPNVVPPGILSFTTPVGIVLNGSPINFSYSTQFSTSRMIFSGPTPFNLATESGTQEIIPPANSTPGIVLVALKDGAPAAVAPIVVRTVIGGTSTYRYVRYKITKRRPGTEDLVQLSEFEFYNTAVSADKLPIASVINPGGDSPAGEGPGNLIDGDNSTKWLDFANRAVIFDFGEEVAFNKYSFVTGNDDVNRDAVQWTMEGSNDEIDWFLIENVNFDYPTPLGRNVSTTPIPLPGASLPARIEFFTGDTATLIEGETLTLSYSTVAAASVTITQDGGDPVPGPLPVSGSVTVTPTSDATYTLTANSLNGSASPATATFSVVVVEDPGVDNIDYANFSEAGLEIDLHRSAAITPEGRLRLTPEAGGLNGNAWFLKKLDGTDGFEANFGMSLNQAAPNNDPPADGVAFVIQNSPLGTGDPGTGETGVTQNALNICFFAFGDARVEVRSGSSVLATATPYNTPGVELYGTPGIDNGGYPRTLGSLSTDPPYKIRVVYVPGDLDVYMDGIAIIQNLDVDLEMIGAADPSGKSYFGFTARTGGYAENNDITSWQVKLGDFSAVPPFGIVKTLFRYTEGNAKPTSVDLVWNASAGASYDTVSSLDLDAWDFIATQPGVDGQIGVSIDIPSSVSDAAKAFFRVEEFIIE